jgi:Predicted transcriptional regulator with an HTH domain
MDKLMERGGDMKRAEYLKKKIEETGMSMKAFAEKAGIPYTTLYSILERGVGKASVDNVIKICKTLGITVEEMENAVNDDIQTIAAHHDGEDWTEEELAEIERFKAFLRARRKMIQQEEQQEEKPE